jgi:hypothetical protein
MFIPASGAYVHLFRPRPERGNEKPNGFQENHSIFTKNERFSGKPSGFLFSLISKPFSLR